MICCWTYVGFSMPRYEVTASEPSLCHLFAELPFLIYKVGVKILCCSVLNCNEIMHVKHLALTKLLMLLLVRFSKDNKTSCEYPKGIKDKLCLWLYSFLGWDLTLWHWWEWLSFIAFCIARLTANGLLWVIKVAEEFKVGLKERENVCHLLPSVWVSGQ